MVSTRSKVETRDSEEEYEPVRVGKPALSQLLSRSQSHSTASCVSASSRGIKGEVRALIDAQEHWQHEGPGSDGNDAQAGESEDEDEEDGDEDQRASDSGSDDHAAYDAPRVSKRKAEQMRRFSQRSRELNAALKSSRKRRRGEASTSREAIIASAPESGKRKRGQRGRPRKQPLPSPPPTGEDQDGDEAEEPPAKRGRGRPRKNALPSPPATTEPLRETRQRSQRTQKYPKAPPPSSPRQGKRSKRSATQTTAVSSAAKVKGKRGKPPGRPASARELAARETAAADDTDYSNAPGDSGAEENGALESPENDGRADEQEEKDAEDQKFSLDEEEDQLDDDDDADSAAVKKEKRGRTGARRPGRPRQQTPELIRQAMRTSLLVEERDALAFVEPDEEEYIIADDIFTRMKYIVHPHAQDGGPHTHLLVRTWERAYVHVSVPLKVENLFVNHGGVVVDKIRHADIVLVKKTHRDFPSVMRKCADLIKPAYHPSFVKDSVKANYRLAYPTLSLPTDEQVCRTASTQRRDTDHSVTRYAKHNSHRKLLIADDHDP